MVTNRTVTVRLRADVSGFVRGMAQARAAAAGLSKDLNTANDTTSWLVGSLLALAPAAVPIGAVAVPAVAALATQAGLAAAAGGTMALAFIGVGDALGKLNDYQLDPTKENLKELNEAMAKLGPDGAEFVKFLDSVGPQFNELRLAARAGMFPGIEDGITAFLDRLPDLKAVVTEISTTVGTLATDMGEGLAGPEFDEFFEFLKTDAGPILLDTGRAIGNFTDGLASMMVAFSPATQDFSEGLLDMSRRFEQWSEGLSDSRSFQEFIDYTREVTPQVKAFLGQLVDTFVDLAKAAAPVGQAMLPVLTTMLNILGEIADTPVGSILIAVTAVSSLAGRLVALRNLASGGIIGSLATGQFLALGRAADDAGKKVAATNKAVAASGATAAVAGRSWRGASTLGLFALGTGLSLVHTESDKANTALGILGSTATGAALGSMILPGWGTAIGTVGGYVYGVVDALGDAEAATQRAAMAAEEWKNAFPTQRELDDLTRLLNPGIDVPKELRPVAPERPKNIKFTQPSQQQVSMKVAVTGGEATVQALTRVARAAKLTPPQVKSRFLAEGWHPKIIAAVVAELRRAKALGNVRAILQQTGWSPAKIDTAAKALANAKSKADVKSTLTKRGWETKDINVVAKLFDVVGAKKPAPTVSLKGAKQAAADARAVADAIGRIPRTKTSEITTRYRTVGKPPGRAHGGAIERFDSGGAVRGPGGDTDDLIDARLSNGEHVLTASDVRMLGGQDAVYRMRGQAQAGMLRFAAGGAVAPTWNQQELERAQVWQRIEDLNRQLNDGENPLTGWARTVAHLELNEAWGDLSKLDQKRAGLMFEAVQQIADAVGSGTALSGLFGESSSPWTTPQSSQSILAGARERLAGVTGLGARLAALKAKGLSGLLLQEIAGMGIDAGTRAADILLSDPSTLSALSATYAEIGAYTQAAGRVVVNATTPEITVRDFTITDWESGMGRITLSVAGAVASATVGAIR